LPSQRGLLLLASLRGFCGLRLGHSQYLLSHLLETVRDASLLGFK